MKKNIAAILLAAVSLVGCSDFLETESYTVRNSGNFPATADDVQDLVTGAYASQTSYINNSIRSTPYFSGECASDERLGGAGITAYNVQCLDKLMAATDDDHTYFWKYRYKGIYRANLIIETIDRCTGFEDEDEKNHMLGEAYFLRALFYWELGQQFENIPMPLSTTDYSLTQVTVDELYAQIGSDFVNAIDLLERDQYNTNRTGVATTWAAEGYLARVFLFYTGFYQKDSMPLNDGSLSKSDMVDYLNDCINNSGHGLVSDFRNLWSYSNEYTGETWEYSQENNLKWEGDTNKEIIYSYKFGLLGGSNVSYRNFFVIWSGLPTKLTQDQFYPYGGGWSMGAVCPQLWDEWKAENPDDIRRVGSIIDMEEECPAYTTDNAGFDAWEETLYRAKKFMPIAAKTTDGTYYNVFTHLYYGANNHYLTGQITDFPLMRFADILLMHSELSETADGINQVRARAGLDPVAYSLVNLQKERRWELAFEGVRWNDIRRWHIAEDLLDKQAGLSVLNRGAAAVMPSTIGGGYSTRYKETRGFWMIPNEEIELSNGVMIQNEGWRTGDGYIYSGWS